MSEEILPLVINVTVTNTWTQMKLGSAGSVYAVPTGSTGLLEGLTAMNLGGNSVTIEFAISVNSTITDAERRVPPITLAAGRYFSDAQLKYALLEGEAVWCRAVGTTPNVTFCGALLELTP